LFRVHDRWAELERHLPGEQPEASPESYRWLFDSLGDVHRQLATIDLHVPSPLVSTYASAATLTRWIGVAGLAFEHDDDLEEAFTRVRLLVRRLAGAMTPATALPRHLIHGDARLGNLRVGTDGETVVHDFGFSALRPRVRDVAYSMAYMVHALGGHRDPAAFDWGLAEAVIGEYE